MKFTTICTTVMSATVCALTSSTLAASGGAKAWGYNASGQTTVPITANSKVTAITGGYLHTLAIKNGGVLAWGNNGYGETSVPNAVSSSVPILRPASTTHSLLKVVRFLLGVTTATVNATFLLQLKTLVLVLLRRALTTAWQ